MSSVAQRLAKVVKHRHFVLICVLCGVILRILWIALINPQQVSDYKWYYDRAISIASDGGYSVDGVPTAYW
ncbi:MAG: glycosyl transferase, partial [Acidobacteriota bacterium]|nr:glycosyl transferase [Acidobacteriota bacterium]